MTVTEPKGPDTAGERVPPDLGRAPRVVVVTDFLPVAGVSGIHTYLHSLLGYLVGRGIEVECLVMDRSQRGRTPPPAPGHPRVTVYGAAEGGFRERIAVALARLQPALDRVYALVPPRTRERVRGLRRRLFPARGPRSTEARPGAAPAPPALLGENSRLNESRVRFVRDFVRRERPDVLVADYAWYADIFDYLPPDVSPLRVIFANDILHLQAQRFRARGLAVPHGNWTAETESAAYGKAQLLVAIQHEDAAVLRTLAPTCDVLTVPLALLPRPRTSAPVDGRCLFVGSRAAHNRDGLRWLLTHVWPQVRARHPAATLRVCGAVCADVTGAPPGTELLGPVESLTDEYHAASVVVVPLLAGSGLKIKLVEALAHGCCCVTTPIGLEGLSELADRGVALAREPEEFGTAVVRFLSDAGERRRFEHEALRYVTDRLAPQVVYEPVVSAIRAHAARDRDGRAGGPATTR